MTPDGPTLATQDHRADALSWAARSRERREELRVELSSGRRTLGDVLAARQDEHDGRVRLLYVLESLPGAGKVATRRRMAQLGLEEATPLHDLDDAACAVVLAEFPVGADS